jgi:predicted DNA-binding ribbon-helix-helix protein
MKRGKSSISKAKSYREIGDFWDTHDLSDLWDQTKRVNFDVNIESEITYYSLEKRLAKEVQSIAQKRGVSADTLINLWVQEKIQEQNQ